MKKIAVLASKSGSNLQALIGIFGLLIKTGLVNLTFSLKLNLKESGV